MNKDIPTCTHRLGDLFCGAPATARFQQGWRCDEHDIRALNGLAPLPPSPGIPNYRKENTA